LGEIINIDINWLKKYARFSGDTLRNKSDSEEYNKLFWSIVEDGLLEPIQLLVSGGIPIFRSGNHRLDILDKLGYRKVPVLVLEDGDILECGRCGRKYIKNNECNVCPKSIKSLEGRR